MLIYNPCLGLKGLIKEITNRVKHPFNIYYSISNKPGEDRRAVSDYRRTADRNFETDDKFSPSILSSFRLSRGAKPMPSDRSRSPLIVLLRVGEGRFHRPFCHAFFCFHLCHLLLSEALPRIVSLVASHLNANKRQLCEGRLHHYAFKAAVSSVMLLIDIGSPFSPGLAAQNLKFIEWMQDTPMDVEEENIYDYYLEDRFGGIPYDGGEGRASGRSNASYVRSILMLGPKLPRCRAPIPSTARASFVGYRRAMFVLFADMRYQHTVLDCCMHFIYTICI